MRRLLPCHFVMVSFCGLSQTFSSHSIALTPTAFPDYKFDEDAYLQKIKSRYSSEGDQELVKQYAEFCLADKKSFFNSNEIYTNWQEATDFVKNVFYKTVPQGFATENIQIFVNRSPDFNAYCMEDGNILVTTGFLAFMNSEAELAATLAHEYGHFYCNHNFHHFKEKAKVSKNLISNSLFSGARQYYDALRNDERRADTFAYHFFRKNGYAPSALVSDFENFDLHTRKYKSLRGYRKQSSYFSSHPTTEERIKKAKAFTEQLNISGKLFQVDSSEFARIKKRAVDECIYLLYEELRFDECLELAFLQHLYYPKDEFYLYFIIESLRSKNASEKYYCDYPFITLNYNPSSLCKEKFYPCYVNKDGHQVTSKDFKFSIFNNLKSPIYGLGMEDISRIRAKELMNRDTIAFFTNRQALEYFSKKMPAESSIFNTLRMKFGVPLATSCSVIPTNSELENDFCEIENNFKKYESSWDSLDKGMIILHDVNFYQWNGTKLIYFNDVEKHKKIFHQYREHARNYQYMDIINENILNFRERSKIKHIANFSSYQVEKGLFGNSYDIDFLEVCPEFVLQSIKNKLETIFIVNLYMYSVPHSQAIVYAVDVRNKRISIVKIPLEGTFNMGSVFIFEKVFKECESMIKN